VQDFRKFEVWQRARVFVVGVYEVANEFPPFERFGLASQVRRAVTSIPANIAEGAAKPSSREFARFLDIAVGSANEVESHLITAADLGYLKTARSGLLQRECGEIRAMLRGLRRSVLADTSDP
jgi:four helix bundle protein